MKERVVPALFIALAAATTAAEEPPPAWVDEARSGARTLGSQLKQALQAAIAEGGPVAGIDACRIQAPEIAESVSGKRLEVGRTSLRVRNPDNAPDPWEARVLEDFERRLAAGEEPAGIETFVIRRQGERRFGHWMKAIPTEGLCTACHGQQLAPELAEAVDETYPRDRARGFSVGDLRGAFTVEVEIEAN